MKRNKHEALVRQIAEQMAAEKEGIPVAVFRKEWAVDILRGAFIPYAQIAVKHMADEYRAGYMSNCPDNDDDTEDIWKENCHYEMVDRGLIPDPDQEAGKP